MQPSAPREPAPVAGFCSEAGDAAVKFEWEFDANCFELAERKSLRATRRSEIPQGVFCICSLRQSYGAIELAVLFLGSPDSAFGFFLFNLAFTLNGRVIVDFNLERPFR